jgi:hypothetical protein
MNENNALSIVNSQFSKIIGAKEREKDLIYVPLQLFLICMVLWLKKIGVKCQKKLSGRISLPQL